MAILAVQLTAILALLLEAVQRRLRTAFKNQHARISIVPLVLTGVFVLSMATVGVWDLRLAGMVLIYLSAPVALVRVSPFLAVLALWLPMEFSAGARLVPRAAQGFLHSVAYGVAILLALVLFLAYRPLSGMKYSLPQKVQDFRLPFAAFAMVSPILIALGIAMGFIPWPHLPAQSGSRTAAVAGIIFAGTALPEEILFRSLIQNLLMQRFGSGTVTLLAASVIFGAAHLNNGGWPNWRYAILATIAGIAYGRVFQKASTVLSSATLHMLVDWTKHLFF